MSAFNSLITTAGKVDRLIRLIETNTFFFAFGKSTPWDESWGDNVSDANPPAPQSTTEQIPEIFGFKAAYKVLPAVQSCCGTIPFESCLDEIPSNRKWQTVEIEGNCRKNLNIIAPTKLYISVELQPREFLKESFRAVGLYLNPTFKATAPAGQIFYTPDQVENPGILYWASFSSPVLKQVDKKTELEILVSL